MIMTAWRSSRNLVSQREGRTMKPFWMTLFLSVTFVILPQAVAHDRDNAMRIVRLETNSDQGGRPDYDRPYAGDYPRVKVDTDGKDRKSTRLNSSHVSESRMP